MEEISKGDRVVAEQGAGVIRFIGETSFADGEWVGVELDQPDGKNNGSVHNVTYFTCEDKHGIFVRRKKLRLVFPSKPPNVNNLSFSHDKTVSKKPVSSTESILSRIAPPSKTKTFIPSATGQKRYSTP